jgi:Glycosyl hydrolases family 32 C terminal/Secretion system C-terminal sorting domain
LQYCELIFDFINKEIIFDRSRVAGAVLGADPNFKDLMVAPLIVENGFIDLQLFVDNSSVELFTAGGKVVMSNLIFPDSTSNKIELTSFDDDFAFENFDIWKLEKRAYVPAPPTTGAVKYSIFKVYPNPVVDNNGVTIKIKDEMAGKVTFNLFDATGKLITEFQPSSNSIIVPRNKLSPGKGLYFLKGSDGQTSQTEKLLLLGQ